MKNIYLALRRPSDTRCATASTAGVPAQLSGGSTGACVWSRANLPRVLSVVKYLLVASAWLVLNIVQRVYFTRSLNLQFLILDLQKKQ